jgi:hypothetical protein
MEVNVDNEGRRRRKRCHYCENTALKNRAWCRPCLNNIRRWGVVDLVEYPTQEDERRIRAPLVVDLV